MTFGEAHYSYQGVGVFRLVSGMYDGRHFEVQAYQCACGSGASCFSKVAVSMNSSDPECTRLLGPVDVSSTSCSDDGGTVALLDDWGVELTADGMYVTLPEDLIGSNQLEWAGAAGGVVVDQCAEPSRCSRWRGPRCCLR